MTVFARHPPLDGRTPSHHRPAGDHLAALPVAVAEPVAALVTGPLRAATVLGSHAAAVILTLDGPVHPGAPADRRTRVISVLAAEASGVPNGARTALHAADRPFAHLAPGDAARVGAGRIDLPGLTFHIARTVRTAVPTMTPHPEAVAVIAAAARSAPRGVPDGPVTALETALTGDDPGALAAAVDGLVGLGTGSTPGGDDVLAGTLAALVATGRDRLAGRIAATALAGIEDRTPALSAELLRLAVNGHVCAEAAAVMRAAAHPPAPAPDARMGGSRHAALHASPTRAPHGSLNRALVTLLRIGHTSGADLATGLALAWSVDRPADRPTDGPTDESTGHLSSRPTHPSAADREER